MPRKNTRASRQAGRQRRPAPGPQRVATPSGPLVREPEPATTSEAAASTAAPTELIVRPRSSQKVAASAPRAATTAPQRAFTPRAGTGSLSSDQVRAEIRFIRGDLMRMLITTALVVAFMIGALLILS